MQFALSFKASIVHYEMHLLAEKELLTSGFN